jgi:hypothetical protein
VSDPRTFLGFRFYTVAPGEASADLEVVIACLGALALAFGFFVPMEWIKPFLGACKFKLLTGMPCGTCGATRAVEALFAARFGEFFRINPFFSTALLAGLAYVPVAWVVWLAKLRRPRFGIPSARARWIFVLTLVVLFFGNWAYLIIEGR